MVSEEPQVGGDSGASLLLNQPVVIDVGTSSLKAGFAGSSKPKVRESFQFFSSGQHGSSHALVNIGGHRHQGWSSQAHANNAWRCARGGAKPVRAVFCFCRSKTRRAPRSLPARISYGQGPCGRWRVGCHGKSLGGKSDRMCKWELLALR